jgi:hypothetical protein
MDKHFRLLRKLINYGRKKFYNIGPKFRSLIQEPFNIFELEISSFYWIAEDNFTHILHLPLAI